VAVDMRSRELQFACPRDFVDCVRAALARNP
jgi:hypothetical protein